MHTPFPTPQELAPSEDPRATILESAEYRFKTSGFRKTTIAEIAAAARMSPANLYRYFDGKREIGAACCDRWLSARIETLRALAHQKGLSASQRLVAVISKNQVITSTLSTQNPHIYEMVESIAVGHPELVRRKVDAMVSLFAEILAYGNETGEYAVDNVVTTARSVHAAQVVFEVPLFSALYPVADFERMVANVSSLLVSGLAKRRAV